MPIRPRCELSSSSRAISISARAARRAASRACATISRRCRACRSPSRSAPRRDEAAAKARRALAAAPANAAEAADRPGQPGARCRARRGRLELGVGRHQQAPLHLAVAGLGGAEIRRLRALAGRHLLSRLDGGAVRPRHRGGEPGGADQRGAAGRQPAVPDDRPRQLGRPLAAADRQPRHLDDRGRTAAIPPSSISPTTRCLPTTIGGSAGATAMATG